MRRWAAILVVLLAGCRHPDAVPQASTRRQPVQPLLVTHPPPAAEGVLAVATVFPSVGRYGGSGVQSEQGALLAVEEKNAAGGVHGRRLQLLAYRTGSYFADARAAADLAAREGRALAIVGSNSSSLSQAVAEVARAQHLPQLTNVSTSRALTRDDDGSVGDGFVFRMCATDEVIGERLAAFAWDALHARRAGALYELSRAYSSGLAASFLAAFARRGGDDAVHEEFYLPLETDFRPHLERLKAFAPDVLIAPGSFTDASLIATQAHGMGLESTLLGGDGWSSPLLFWSGGPARPAYHADLCVVPPAFRERYERRFPGSPVDCRALLAHDAVIAVAAALQQMGPLASDDLQARLPRTRWRLHEALARLEVAGQDAEIRFDGHGDALRNVAITKVVPNGPVYEAASLGWLALPR